MPPGESLSIAFRTIGGPMTSEPDGDADENLVSLPGDMSAFGAISVGLIGTFVAGLFVARLTPATEAYRPLISQILVPEASLLLAVLGIAGIRYAGWLSKRTENWAHILAMATVPIFTVYSTLQFGSIDEQLSQRAACERKLVTEIDDATSRQSGAKAALRRCKTDFEENRPLFSSTTVDMHCKPIQRSVDAATQVLKSAAEKICVSGVASTPTAPATTGSVR